MATVELTLAGSKVVVTGKIAGHSRATAETLLRQAGAQVQAAVTSSTDLLVVGVDVGQTKLKAATKHGVLVVPWDDAVVLAEGGQPSSLGIVPGGGTAAPMGSPNGYRPVGPMLCKKTDELPLGPGWTYEIKWDGHRGVATVCDGVVRIDSRSGNDNTERFAAIASELAAFPNCVLDGELVALDEDGRSAFQLLGDETARFMVFDILEYDGNDFRNVPLHQRRAMLEVVFSYVAAQLGHAPVLIAQSPYETDGQKLWAYAQEARIEGIVCKRDDSVYQEGARPNTWLKLKLRAVQEFLIVGHTPGKGALEGHVGAWLLGVYDHFTNDGSGNGVLAYCGKVGTGGDGEQWDAIERSLTVVDVPTVEIPKDAMGGPERATVTWVAPTQVVQVAFQRWTEDGRLVHPSFLGVRDDKDPRDVVRED